MADAPSPPPPLPLATELAGLLEENSPQPTKKQRCGSPERLSKNNQERNRRSALSELFDELRDELPEVYRDASRKIVLAEAIRCIRELKVEARKRR